MADITIEPNVFNLFNESVQPRSMVWVNSGVGYVFYIDPGQDFIYRKTTNGGSSYLGSVRLSTRTHEKFGVWYDGWTRGITGSLIHIAAVEASNSDIYYTNLDTTDDTQSTLRTVFDGVSTDLTENWANHCISITKSRGGSIYVGGWIDNDAENGFFVSSDVGSNWTSLLTVADGIEVDKIQLLPGSGTNLEDIWCIYYDVSASNLRLNIYDSAGAYSKTGSWVTGTIVDVSITNGTQLFQLDSTSRHSDDHALVAIWTDPNNITAGSIHFWDIAGSNSAVSGGDILQAAATVVVSGTVGILLNQQNNDLYAGYYIHAANINGSVVYKKSTDGGTTWGAESAMSQTNNIHKLFMGGTSIGNDGGRFQPVWFNDSLNDLVTNRLNSVEIGGSVGAAAGNWYIYQINNPFINITYPIFT